MQFESSKPEFEFIQMILHKNTSIPWYLFFYLDKKTFFFFYKTLNNEFVPRENVFRCKQNTL